MTDLNPATNPEAQFAESRKYVAGAFVLRIPHEITDRYAIFDNRRQLLKIVTDLLEALDIIAKCSIIPEPAPARPAVRGKVRLTLEDLGL